MIDNDEIDSPRPDALEDKQQKQAIVSLSLAEAQFILNCLSTQRLGLLDPAAIQAAALAQSVASKLQIK